MSRALGEEHLEILKSCYDSALALLQEHRDHLEAVASLLLEQEKIDSTDLRKILGPRPDEVSQEAAQEAPEEAAEEV